MFKIVGILIDGNGNALSGSSVNVTGPGIDISVYCNNVGGYILPGLANGTYVVTPTLGGHTFSPLNQTVIINGSNVYGINFN